MRRLAVALAWLACLAAIAPAALADRRVALVVGNGGYQNTAALANPRNDALDMTAALKGFGFEVVEALDAGKHALDAALRTFADKLARADVALFYYAGHGLQVGLQNYLVPVDARLDRERDLEFEAVKLEFVMRQMEIDREGRTSIIFLDACRDNPLTRNLARTMGTRSTAIGNGLAPAPTGLGTFIAYSTQPGNTALDGEGTRNSPFTTALLRHMKVEGRTLASTMIEVRKDVVAATGGRQVPWDHSAMTGNFYFVPRKATTAGTASPPQPGASSADVVALQERLKKLEDEAKARETAAAPAGGAPAAKRQAYIVRANNRIEGVRLPDRPTTANCESQCQSMGNCQGYNLSREGVCELFSAIQTRIEAQGWRSGVRADAISRPQTSATASPASASTDAAKIPPVEPKSTPGEAKARLLSREEGVRIDGNRIAESRQPNSDACRRACATTPGCIAFQHGRKIPVMGQCHLFDRIDRREQDPNWRSGVSTDAAAGQPAAGTDGTLPKWSVVSASETIDGDHIKDAAADSIEACMVVCRHTPGCVAATFHEQKKQTAAACAVYRTMRGLRCCQGTSARWDR